MRLERESFTLSPRFTAAVETTFIHLHKKGLLYRGKYLINWCPRCLTALSNEEAIPKDIAGDYWFIRYPLENRGGFVVIATTRPETMFGDTAVAVNPKDETLSHLIGCTARLPFLDRPLPVIGDYRVKYGTEIVGTGALKVTPAHDPVDFEIGRDHNLARIDIFTPDAKLNETAGEFAGLDRFEARQRVVEALQQQGLLEKVESTTHAIAHCERCDTVLEPRLSTQWFVRMKPLAEPALKAHMEGTIKWHPERWGRYYERWMREIRDWCISRQLWWGHRVPAWYCLSCCSQYAMKVSDTEYLFEDGAEPIVSIERPEQCPKCGGADLVQDPDVLDTWFSSWIWPLATLGWPEETDDLATYYPTNTLVTGPDIIFFWVARMIMAGFELRGREPFSDVYIHGLVCDERGRIMHKSLGNGIDPVEMIKKYGADALRFALVFLTSEGQNCLMSEQRIDQGKRFCIKLWSASRLVLSIADRHGLKPLHELDLEREDLWIVRRACQMVESASAGLDRFRFNESLNLIYEFFWRSYCDSYLEMIKPRIYGDDGASKQAAQATAVTVLDLLLRLFHPFVPFITEEVWLMLHNADGRESEESIMRAPFPEVSDFSVRFSENVSDIDTILEIIHQLRSLRAKYNIGMSRPLSVIISPLHSRDDSTVSLAHVRENARLLRNLGNIGDLLVVDNEVARSASAALVVGGLKITVPLAGAIDIDKERARIGGSPRAEATGAQLGRGKARQL